MNENRSMVNKVNSILAEQLGVPKSEITDSLQFGDIPQWDSLGHMAIIAALEEEFQVEVDADLIAELTNVRAIVTYLEGKKNE